MYHNNRKNPLNKKAWYTTNGGTSTIVVSIGTSILYAILCGLQICKITETLRSGVTFTQTYRTCNLIHIWIALVMFYFLRRFLPRIESSKSD